MKEVNDEEIARLIKEASKLEPEARYILRLKEWSRPGPSFEDWGQFRIVYGEARELLLGTRYEYPTVDEQEYAIIPLSVPVVVRAWGRMDYGKEYREWEELHIFTREGWKKVII